MWHDKSLQNNRRIVAPQPSDARLDAGCLRLIESDSSLPFLPQKIPRFVDIAQSVDLGNPIPLKVHQTVCKRVFR